MTTDYRAMSVSERRIVERLLGRAFVGVRELRKQLENARVRTIDANGSLDFICSSRERASVDRRVPTEAETVDRDGVVIHVLLHVVEGALHELEIFKEDGSNVLQPVSPETLSVIE
jgi:hypothetical protein